VLPLFILVPLFCLILLNVPPKAIVKRPAFWLVAALPLVQVFLTAFHPVAVWDEIRNPFNSYFIFNLSVDALSTVLLLSIGIVVFIAALVGRYTLSGETQRFNFFNLLLVAFLGMNATVMVQDIFALYVFIEVTAVASFILIAMQKDKPALEGAFKYIILSVVATVLMLSSIALIVMAAGDTSFAAVSSAIRAYPASVLVKVAVNLFLCGLFIKAGIVPFHGWLPDAYSAAPSSVSVLLAGIITKVSGVYVLIRMVVTVFGIEQSPQAVLMFVGALSIVAGALAAIGQSDFKRMLAYSSVSQVGYIILGLGCGTPLALAGAVFHLFNHALFKTLLFVNAAAVQEKLGTVDMNKMSGLSVKMPVTGATSVVALLSTAGIPPLSGFWSKLIIAMALWQSGQYAYTIIAVLASVLTLAYFLSMQRRVFFGKLQEGLENLTEARLGLILPAIILAVVTVGVGLAFPIVLDKLILPVQNILK